MSRRWMTTRLATAALACGAVLGLGGAVASADGPCGQDYTGNTACAVNSASASDYHGTIVAGNDTDYYVFYAAANTHLSLAITDTEDATCSNAGYPVNCGSVGVELYDSQANSIGGTGDNSTPSNGITVPSDWSTIIDKAGTYYLQVSGSLGTDSQGNPSDVPYDLNVQASPAVVWPRPAPPAPAPVPAPAPKPPVSSGPHWASCGGWQFVPRPRIWGVSVYNMSCGAARAAIGHLSFSRGSRWMRRGRRWGLRGGPGPGHYGVGGHGFACSVLREIQSGRGRNRLTVGMSASCASATQRFDFTWHS